MVSAHYARKNGKKPKIAVRAVKAYISKSILQIVWTVTYIIYYICTGPADARPSWPDLQTHGRTHRRADGHAEARTDTQTGGRTRRSTDADAEARMQTQTHGRRSTDADADARTQTQKHGRRRRHTDADASARWRTDAKYSCVQCVGGKIVQTRPASGRTHKDLRGVLYIYIFLFLLLTIHMS